MCLTLKKKHEECYKEILKQKHKFFIDTSGTAEREEYVKEFLNEYKIVLETSEGRLLYEYK